MEKYQNSKIYKLVSDKLDLVYYGSTYCKLSYRLSGHKFDYKEYLKGKGRYMTSFEIVKYASAAIELVEKYPCDTKKELHQREGYYIRNNKCVNKDIPGRTKKEYYQDNKENKKQYQKEYYQDNKEILKQYQKKYREDNQKQINRKIICECGRVVIFRNKTRHNKSKFHHKRVSE